MSKLHTLIEVGFCKSYGDGDYRIGTEIAKLPRERFNELKLSALYALHHAEDMWRRNNQPEAGQQESEHDKR